MGLIREALEEAELDDNTMIVFTSDGGHLWGEQGLIDKRCAYEASMRIPMIVLDPRTSSHGATCEALVTNLDIAPTFLSAAGESVPDWIDGKSLKLTSC